MILKEFNVSPVVIDLFGTKDLSTLSGAFVITSQNVTGEKLFSFPLGLRPHELNIRRNNFGEAMDHLSLIRLQKIGDIAITPHHSEVQIDRYRYYYGLPAGIVNNLFKMAIQRQGVRPVSKKDALKRLLPNQLQALIKKIRFAFKPSR